MTRIYKLLIDGLSSKLFLLLSFVWFWLQGLFFALTIKAGVPPDESYHLSFIRLFTHNGFSPFIQNSSEYLHLGEVVYTPFFLYHYIFSFPYFIIERFDWAYIVLRLMNLLIATGSLYLVYLIALELNVSKLVRNLSIFMLVNTLMFVFLSSSVSYDNLFILTSLGLILGLMKLFRGITALRVLSFLVIMCVGALVKVNFLPLAFFAVLALLYHKRKNLKNVWPEVKSSFHKNHRINILLCVILGLTAGLCMQRYGYNLVKFQTYAPSCTEVRTVDECRKHALFVRNEQVYGSRKIQPTKDPSEYFFDWAPLMLTRTYGVFAHKEMPANVFILAWAQVYILLGVVAIARLWNKNNKLVTLALLICLCYIVVLVIENYSIYRETGRLGFVVHGRYLFAVLPIIYMLLNYYILELLHNRLYRTVFIICTLCVFLASGLVTFIKQDSAQWYSQGFVEKANALTMQSPPN